MNVWEKGSQVKIVAKPVEMIAYFEEAGGALRPIRFRMEEENDRRTTIKVDQVLCVDLEKLAGHPMYVYRCQSVIDGATRVFELKYDVEACKWMLFKI